MARTSSGRSAAPAKAIAVADAASTSRTVPAAAGFPDASRFRFSDRPGFRVNLFLNRGWQSNLVRIDLPETMGSKDGKLRFIPVMAMPGDVQMHHRGYEAKGLNSEVVANWAIEEDLTTMSLSVKNTGKDIAQAVNAALCVQAGFAPDFNDGSRQRVWIFVDGKPVHFTDLAERDGYPSFSCLVKGMNPDPGKPAGIRNAQAFFSRSNVEVDDGVICVTTEDGLWTLATVWEGAETVFNNAMPGIACIHSNPSFGDIAPGQTVTRQGWVVIVKGSPADAHRRLLELLRVKGASEGNPEK